MTANFLKLNEDKTEILIISRKKDIDDHVPNIKIGDANVEASHSAKNIGVIFDKTLNMDAHINATCKRAFWEIRNIGRIRPYLDEKSTASLVHSFVSSKLDYCNSLLYGLPKKQHDKFQRVLNCAARVVAKVRKHDHITPTLSALHWLPIPQRIEFKLLLLTFKALNGLAPEYLAELLNLYKAPRTLRSDSQALLEVPKTKFKYFGDRSFFKAAPVLWNKLPLYIRKISDLEAFKCALKTHLYRAAFS
jgi:hypothetical protein